MADDGILGLLGKLNDPAALYEGALTDPATRQAMAGRGLLAMAGSFADSAMPTRMPTPFGAVLGHAAGAAGSSEDAAMAARLQAAQGKQALGIAALTQSKADLIKSLPGDTRDYYGMDGGGGIASAPPPGSTTVPGTLGSPAVATGSVNTGRGPDGVIIPPGTPTATHDPKLSGSDNLGNLAQAAAPIALPPGYTMEVVSGNRPGATVAGTGGPSQHANANAIDIVIKRPDGSEVKNDGPDTEGVYGRVAVVMRAIADPSIKPWLAWGGNFGKSDIMHFDYAGDRGTAGSLAAMEKNLLAPPRPVQVAQNVPPGTMSDVPPPGMAAATAAPPRPPGLLGPSGQSIAQLADQAMAQRPPAPPGLLNAPPPGAATAPISPETIATLKAAGATDAEIARIVAAPSGPPPGPGAAVAPPGPQVAASGPPPQIPAERPQSLIPPPAAQPPVPPITQPQVAAAPAPTAGPVIPGAPSPAKIAAAQRLAWKYTMAGLSVPADVAETAKFGLDVAKAGATAAATAPTEIAKAIAIAKGTSPIEVQKAIDIANGTLAAKIAEAQAGPRESGAQARQTAAEALGNEYVNMPALGGWIQRKNIPGFSTTVAGAGGGRGTVAPQPAPGTGASVSSPPGPGTSAAAGGSTAPGPVRGAIPDIAPGQTAGQEAVAKKNADDFAKVHADADAASQMQSQATNMRQEAQNFYTGPGAEYNQAFNKVLATLTGDPERANKVASYETFIKDTGFFAREQARLMGARVGVQELTMVRDSLAGPTTTARGIDRVMAQVQGLADFRLVKQQAMNDYVSQQGQGGWDNRGFEAQFNKNVSPYTFMWMRLSDQDKGEMRTKLLETKEGRADLQRLNDQINYVTKNNLTP